MHGTPRFQVLVSVRCLGCGSVYAKPVGGGTAAMNPGCPQCEYLGWQSLRDEELSPQFRSAVGRRLRRHG
jgi:hypothetical protein